MRARYPDREGVVHSGGVPIAYEVHGEGEHTVLLLPAWQIAYSRVWKMQVPYLSRYARVVTFDPPGAGRSGRPATGFDFDRATGDALAVLDAVGADRASIVGLSRGAWPAVILAAEHPERVERLVLTACALDPAPRGGGGFHQAHEHYEGWAKFNAHYWRAHYREWAQFFWRQVFNEPHSTKPREDGVGWTLETTPEILIATIDEARCRTPLAELLRRVACPTLLVHGTEDTVRPLALSERAHEAITGSVLVPLEGSGHVPPARDPVRYNLLVRDFLAPAAARPRAWRRAAARRRRAPF